MIFLVCGKYVDFVVLGNCDVKKLCGIMVKNLSYVEFGVWVGVIYYVIWGK